MNFADSQELLYGLYIKQSIDFTVQCGSFFTGALFAYKQTSSGKTYNMMGDQRNEGVIPKTVGKIYDYIEKVRHMYS